MAKLSSKNFTFHQSTSSNNNHDSKKCLAVLFAWLFAKERHLDKYRLLYLERGFDVLTVKPSLVNSLFPEFGTQQIAASVVNFLAENQDSYGAFVFHAFSLGSYQLGEVFVQLEDGRHDETRRMLKGLVFDSAVADLDGAAVGFAKASTNSPTLQAAIMGAVNLHFWLCYNFATRHYLASAAAVRNHKLGCPTLVFLSKDDPVVNYEETLSVIDQWRQVGVPVQVKSWDQSPHVSHYFKHPHEYQTQLDEFLQSSVKIG